MLGPGDPAPWIRATIDGGPANFPLENLAGRYTLFLFYGCASTKASASAFVTLYANRDLFDDVSASFVGITNDARDSQSLATARGRGIRHILDLNGSIAHAFGALELTDEGGNLTPLWFLVDPTFQVRAVFPMRRAEDAIAALAVMTRGGPAQQTPPLLLVDGVFEPELCGDLIAHFKLMGGEISGFMTDGSLGEEHDPSHKQRLDCSVLDANLKDRMIYALRRRLVPLIERSFCFSATHVERFLVAQYGHEGKGFFGKHRDSNMPAYAHRRLAVTINLNEEYVGGELRFAEFGRKTYRPRAGSAIVFSGSLLHEVTPIVEGHRFTFLSFLFDDAANRLLEQNHPGWPKGQPGALA